MNKESKKFYKLVPFPTNGHRGENFLLYSCSPDNEQAVTLERHSVGSFTGQKLAELFESSDKVFAKSIRENQEEEEAHIASAVQIVSNRLQDTDEDQDKTTEKFSFRVPKCYGQFEVKGNTVNGKTILMLYEHINCKSKIIESLKIQNTKDFFDFARGFCRVIQLLHNQGIVHSMIVPRNFLCETKNINNPESIAVTNISLVGFGYASSFDSESRYSGGIQQHDLWYQAPECRRNDVHDAFWYPTDIYSIGAILYRLVLSNLPDSSEAFDILRDPPRDVIILKDHISKYLKVYANKIFLGNENITKILDTCLRHEESERFVCVEEIQRALDIALITEDEVSESTFSREDKKATKSEERENLDSGVGISGRGTFFSTRELKVPRFFKQMFKSRYQDLTSFYDRLADKERTHIEVYGGRDEIIYSLCDFLANSRSGSTYCTMSLPDYWADHNLGSNGRFLTMNKHMVRQGVNIERLFLVGSEKFHQLPQSDQAILARQYEAVKEIEVEKEQLEETDRRKYGELNVRIADRIPADAVSKFEILGSLVAFLEGEVNDDLVCLNFFSQAVTEWLYGKPIVRRTIKKVRYWSPEEGSNRMERFKESRDIYKSYLNDSISLGQYINRNNDDFTNLDLSEVINRAE